MEKLCATDEMIKMLEKRERSVLAEIEKNYGALMRSIASNLRVSSDDAEECINDTLFEVWNTIPPQKPKSIRSYVCMLMRRTVIDRIRYNSAEKRANTVYLEVSKELEDCINIERMVIDRICVREILNKFLAKQTVQNREIFIRRYFEFESVKVIAFDMFISSNTVDKRLSRMRSDLKNMLNEWGYINE